MALGLKHSGELRQTRSEVAMVCARLVLARTCEVMARNFEIEAQNSERWKDRHGVDVSSESWRVKRGTGGSSAVSRVVGGVRQRSVLEIRATTMVDGLILVADGG
ncbi:hypothetical protein TorRG33x02_204280 [Trema orientale]|uniref:Uncharacterized protein n=1 Tax=Trema orientale TaxID=63057 RepID=A0A2P5EE08_TREOI|nr:hypothetical protein TorRG33x02_204280 [Trema orientale]